MNYGDVEGVVAMNVSADQSQAKKQYKIWQVLKKHKLIISSSA
ncbi:MAG: hypothetical protein R6U08_04985 [Bacillota bacterium]